MSEAAFSWKRKRIAPGSGAKRIDPVLALLQTVLDELRKATAKFTDPASLRASKAARRQRLSLFTASR
jgi:hypothetical protein